MTRRYSAHYIVFRLFAPLYDLGVWLFALPFGGEARLRQAVMDEVSSAGRGSRRPIGLEGSRVLEIFAGTATLSLLASERGAIVTAVDINRGMLLVAAEKVRRAGGRVGLARADAARLPFAGDTFDCVMASLGLHEAPQDRIPVILGEVCRVLKKGGQFTIFDFHRAEGKAGWLQKVFFVFAEGETARAWVGTDLQTRMPEAGFVNFRRRFLHNRFFQVLSADKR